MDDGGDGPCERGVQEYRVRREVWSGVGSVSEEFLFGVGDDYGRAMNSGPRGEVLRSRYRTEGARGTRIVTRSVQRLLF
ncbi:Hypothetical predicted protein [Marmota monax]|uniref:Uncharacterized protein n=1 Tax=Marmota monax TaxID=9995 RepID=A0A5E4C1D5_MARMO|nr:Hypothetical predicted protein [Marmota monax]